MGVTADVQGAVALRAWALTVLGRHGDTECPEVSPAAWDLFLEGERCALPLLRVLEGGSGLSAVPGRHRDRFRKRVEGELARVESARRHLEVLAAIGHGGGWPVVVFKGAATALDLAEAVDMEDVDVLVCPNHVPALVGELTRVGYVDAGRGASARHIAALGNGDLLKIDLHFTLDIAGGGLDPRVWSGIRPCRDREGLWTLAPPDHVWLMLTHVVVEHPNRRSNIRELLLLQSQLGGDTGVWRAVERRIVSHPHRAALAAVLREVDALNRGDPPTRASHGHAAATYTVRRLLGRWTLPTTLMQWCYQMSFALLLGGAARRGIWQRLFVRGGRSQHQRLASFEDHYPVAGVVLRLAGRFTAVLASLVVALPVSALTVVIRWRVLRRV